MNTEPAKSVSIGTEIELAISAVLKDVKIGRDSNDVLKLTQSVLNLAHAIATLAGAEAIRR